MNPLVALLLTIAIPVVAVIAAGVWHRAADLVSQLRALDVEGIHFER